MHEALISVYDKSNPTAVLNELVHIKLVSYPTSCSVVYLVSVSKGEKKRRFYSRLLSHIAHVTLG